jgi:hypothetical protein
LESKEKKTAVRSGAAFGFLKKFKDKIDKEFIEYEPINFYTEKWAVQELIDSYGLPRLYILMDYYFKVVETPSWNHFLKNIAKINKAKKIKDEDLSLRHKLKRQSKKWLNS